MRQYNDVIMSTMAFQITSLTIVFSTQIKENIKASRRWPLGGIHRSHKGSVTRKMIPFDDTIMKPFLPLKLNNWYGDSDNEL